MDEDLGCCMQCGRPLTDDEVGIYKRLVNRGAASFYCLTCLAGYFGCSEELLREKIEHFRRMGCTLFEPNKPDLSAFR